MNASKFTFDDDYYMKWNLFPMDIMFYIFRVVLGGKKKGGKKNANLTV